MGESAGGNLAAVICLLARERGGPSLKHQALLYPGTDVSMSTESFAVNKDAIILTAEDARSFVQHYLGPDADPRDWRISPLHATNHSGLPPAIVIAAGHDPLHDETVSYAHRLRESGVEVKLVEYPAMPHRLPQLPPLQQRCEDGHDPGHRGTARPSPRLESA